MFDPDRKTIGAVWDYLRENKDYPYYLVRSRFAGAQGRSLRAVRPIVRHHHEIVLRLAAVGHRPEQGVGIVGLDVLVDGDDPFAGEAVQR